MDKWIFVNNITSLEKLYTLTLATQNQNITPDNHAQMYLEILNENGASRNEANSHPLKYVLFYKMVYLNNDRYELTKYGKYLVEYYDELVKNKLKRAEFFFQVLNDIKYPSIAVETSDKYNVYPFKIIFKLLYDERINKRLTIQEFEDYLSTVKTEKDYEKIIDIILKKRNGININVTCEKIAQAYTVITGWVNQFKVMKKEGENIMMSDELNLKLPILSETNLIKNLPFNINFCSFVLYEYLFKGTSMVNIEKKYYEDDDRRGFVAKDVIDFFQINNEKNKAIYKDYQKETVINFLNLQNDERYKKIAQILNNKDIINSNKDLSHLEIFKSFFIENAQIKNENTENSIKDREKFVKEYPIECLKDMALEEYFIGTENKNSFCYKLEYGEYKNTALSIGGPTSAKFGIYKKSDGYYGRGNKKIIENIEEYWQELRKQLYQFLKSIENEEYTFNLEDKYPLLAGMSVVLTKLLSLYYPEKFISIVLKEIIANITDYLEIKYKLEDNSDKISYNLNIIFRQLIPEANSYHPYYLSNAIYRFTKEKLLETNNPIDEIENVTGAYSKIFYGIPGCGKSYQVDKIFNKNKGYWIKRTIFHPEYTNSDFVGQIIPKLNDNNVEYIFNPGPFAQVLLYALKHPDQKVCLIIEEINRGQSTTIFGEIFQLLDRNDDGSSKYEIDNAPLIDYLNQKGVETNSIKLPSNLWIVATMNACDQNVFTLDTAFKRRWKREYIPNKFEEDKNAEEYEYSQKLKNTKIPFNGYTNITWGNFVDKINKQILKNRSGLNSEDKQLGVYFVNIDEINNQKEFAEKVLSYLWEDVAKINPEDWFLNIQSYDELLKFYEKDYLKVFGDLFEDDIMKTDVNEDSNDELSESNRI